MVKWTKVNNEEEHKRLIEVWGEDDVDSIEVHIGANRSYPFWFSNDNSRQSDDGYIESTYLDKIVSLEEAISSSEIKIILW